MKVASVGMNIYQSTSKQQRMVKYNENSPVDRDNLTFKGKFFKNPANKKIFVSGLCANLAGFAALPFALSLCAIALVKEAKERGESKNNNNNG